jgi:hypothetical protein
VGGKVEAASHLADGWADRRFEAIDPGVEGKGAVRARGGVAAAGECDAAVAGEDGACLRSLVLER